MNPVFTSPFTDLNSAACKSAPATELSSTRRVTQVTALVMAHGLAATAAYAQTAPAATTADGETPVQLPEHIVQGIRPIDALSSPKFTQPLVDTPKTVTVISKELIEERGATSLADILRTTPGITLGSGEGGTPVGDRPFVRGYEASTDISIDGMRDLGRFSHEAFNLEQVEFVKGPGSAYNGRGSTGGSINLVSKTPKAENFGAISGTAGTDETLRTTIDGNWAFNQSTAFRLNAMYHDGEVAGRDAVEVNRYGFAPSLAFGLGKPTRLTLSYYHLKTDDIPDLGHPFSGGTFTGTTPPDLERDNFYGVVKRDFRETEANIGTVQIEHDFNKALSLSNSTRFLQTENNYIMTRPTYAAGGTTSVIRDFRASRRQNEAFINQTDFTAIFETGKLKHNAVIGAEFSREEIKSGSYATITAPQANAANPNPNDAVTGALTPTAYGVPTKTDVNAIYAFDTLEITPQWMLNFGVRFDDYEIETSPTTGRSDELINYQAGLVYKPTANGSIYFSYGTSSNPAGETAAQAGGADGASGGAAITSDPEQSESLELGTKWNVFNNRLALTFALFETKKTDARTQDPLTGIVVNNGDNRVRGVEFGASGNITEKWQVWGGYTYIDPKLLKYRSGGVDFAGKQMKFVAKSSFSVWTSYALTQKFTLGGGAVHNGKRFVDDANTKWFDPYWRFDAFATFRVDERLSFRLNVQNLADETIYDASHVGVFAVVAPGRSASLSATYRF